MLTFPPQKLGEMALLACFVLWGPHPPAQGRSQARGWMGAVAAGLHHRSSKAGYRPPLRTTHHSPWPRQSLNLLSEGRDGTRVLLDTRPIHFHWAMTGTPRKASSHIKEKRENTSMAFWHLAHSIVPFVSLHQRIFETCISPKCTSPSQHRFDSISLRFEYKNDLSLRTSLRPCQLTRMESVGLEPCRPGLCLSAGDDTFRGNLESPLDNYIKFSIALWHAKH